jgi:diketogulonate reductase-like aldo/keto reductase
VCKNKISLAILVCHLSLTFELHGNITMKLLILFSLFVYVLTSSMANINNIRISQSKRSLFADVPSFHLFNAAETGLHFPALGLGTGFYGMQNEPYGMYPECGDEPHDDPVGPPPPGCGLNTQKMVYTWLSKTNGVRLDCANSYYNQRHVARGIEQSLVNRSQLFILSKVGPTFSLGYNDTIQQTIEILQQLQTDYIDSLLVHWPLTKHPGSSYIPQSSDPLCNITNPLTYDEKKCRLSTWSAMLVLFNRGLVRSIGVSNYNISHLQEMIDVGLPLPSINQVSFNPYNYRTGRANLLAFCQKNRILLVGYSSLGVPDAHQFPVEHQSKGLTGMSRTLLEDPVITSLAKAYNRTPAQILLRWTHQLGVPSNPRSMNETHMIENFEIFSNSFTINDNDMTRIINLAQDTCDVDPNWYECVSNGNLP